MSNLAVKILYGSLNNIDGVVCERVFAPASDFEHLLDKHHIPLYSLESGTVLKDFDLIGFSIGYELAFTNILSVLQIFSQLPRSRRVAQFAECLCNYVAYS